MESARRKRGFMWAATAVGAAALLGIGFWVGASTFGNDDPNLLPAAPTSSSPEATEEPTPISTPTAPQGCSAAELSISDVEPQQGLPPAVEQTRRQIVELALACDFDGLETLAWREGQGFAYSFGTEESPAAFWRMLEEDPRVPRHTRRVTRLIVEMLNLPYCISEEGPRTTYAWPSVHCGNGTDQDWDALRPYYGEKAIDQMEGFGSYFGYRHGITADGDWIYFIAGD